jgi:hypothetical protein
MLEWAFIIYGLGFAWFSSIGEPHDRLDAEQRWALLKIAALWPLIALTALFFWLSSDGLRAALGLRAKGASPIHYGDPPA